MSVQKFLDKIKNGRYGADITDAIIGGIKKCYDDASVNHDNANMEVKMARGTHNTLNDRLDKSDEIQAQTNAQLSEIANKGTTVEVLERATKEEIERQIADGTIANLTIQDKSVTVDKIGEDVIKDGITYLELDKSNLTPGYLSENGTVTNSTIYPEKDKTFDFIPVKPNTKYERNPDGSSKVNRQSVCFYDVNKVFIDIQTNEIGQYKFTTPSNCRFIRIDCLTQYVDVEYIKTGLNYSLNMELIAEGSVTGDKLENNSISLDKLNSDMLTENATNLFDKNSCEPGYISPNTGFTTIAITDRDSTSDYIEVEPQTKYSKNPESSSKFNKQDVAFYDKQKRLLGGLVLEIGEYQFTTPANCYYLRIDCLNAYLDTEMLVKGEASDRYVPFGALTHSLNPEIIAYDSIDLSKIKDVEELVKTDEISVDAFDLVTAEPSGNNLIVNGLTIAYTGAVKKGEGSIVFNNVTGKLQHNGFNELEIFSGHIKGTLKFPKGDRFGKNYVLLANLVEERPYPGCMVRLICANPSDYNIDADEETKYEYYAISLVVCNTQANILIPREELVIEGDTVTASLDFTYHFNKNSGLIRLHDLLHDQIVENRIAGANMVGEEFLTFMCNTAGKNPMMYGEFETFTIDALTTKKVELQHDGDLIEIPNLCMPNTNIPIYSLINNSNSVNLTTEFGNKVSLTVKNDGTITANLKPIATLPSDFPTYTITGESPYDYNFLVTPHTTNYDTGYIFIMNNKGNVLWYKKTNAYCYAFKKYTSPKGKNRYTYIEVTTKNEPTADNATFYEHGDLVILNENFDEIDRVRFKKTEHIPHNHPTEQHDYIYFDDGHYLVMLYHKKKGSQLFENHIQEIKMGKAVWNWTTIDYPILKTLSHTSQTSDYAHINSIQIDYDDNFIVSFRNIGIIKINRESKEIMWVMGRKRNDFSGLESRELPFQQHDIQFAPDGSFTVFDNYGHESKSRVCRYFLDEETMTCLAFREYVTTQDRSAYMGSATIIDDENDIIDIAYGSGWSHIAFEEYDFKNNRQIMMLRFDDGHDLYRIFRDIDFKNTSKFNLNVN